MKKIALIILLAFFVLAGGFTQNSSVCKITSSGLQIPLEFTNFDEFKSATPKIKAVAKKTGDVTIIIPENTYIHRYEVLKKFISTCIVPIVGKVNNWNHMDLYNIENDYYKARERVNRTGNIEIELNARFGQGTLGNTVIAYWQSTTNIVSHDELEEIIEKEVNEQAGLGYITDRWVRNEKQKNKENGLGELTNYQVEVQIKANVDAGFGEYTNFQLDKQREKNQESGFGFITDSETEEQRKQNEEKGLGSFTDKEIETEIAEKEKLDQEKQFYKNFKTVAGIQFDDSFVKVRNKIREYISNEKQNRKEGEYLDYEFYVKGLKYGNKNIVKVRVFIFKEKLGGLSIEFENHDDTEEVTDLLLEKYSSSKPKHVRICCGAWNSWDSEILEIIDNKIEEEVGTYLENYRREKKELERKQAYDSL